jgi:hypothetical protein
MLLLCLVFRQEIQNFNVIYAFSIVGFLMLAFEQDNFFSIAYIDQILPSILSFGIVMAFSRHIGT